MPIGCNNPCEAVHQLLVWSAVLLLLVFASSSATAQSIANPRFSLPIDCEIRVSCFVQNYVDHDPTEGRADYRCGHLSYDKHKGTDIRIRDLVAMQRGVAVLAAADGVVKAVRDGVDDVSIRVGGIGSATGREAGNAVVLTHANEVDTIYAHLRKGSVAVKKGEAVRRGQRIGLVGLSGQTEFPHLHFEVRLKLSVIDPFTAGPMRVRCDSATNSVDLTRSLWAKPVAKKLAYLGTGLIGAGFTDRQPSMSEIEERKHDLTKLAQRAPALVFWGLVYGARKGDLVTLKLLDPKGAVMLESATVVPSNKAQWLRFIGKRRKAKSWAPGVYRGQYRLSRKVGRSEQVVVSSQRVLSVD